MLKAVLDKCCFVNISTDDSVKEELTRLVKKGPASSVNKSENATSPYPKDEELLKLAEEIQSTRSDMTESAEDMLRSANTVSCNGWMIRYEFD